MLFVLSSAEYSSIQSNTTKVKVHLRSGIAEILDQHQDLMGQVENNIIEIETNFENKFEKLFFILQEAVFVVSTKGLDTKSETPGTSVYVYARRVQPLTSNLALDEINKKYEQKTEEINKETEKMTGVEKLTPSQKTMFNSRIMLLQGEADFLKSVLKIGKEFKS
jgi:hypothetical protein